MAAQEPGHGDGWACMPREAIALLAAAIGYALSVCAGIMPDELLLPTPCTGWDTGTLLAHLAASIADLEAGIRLGYLALDLKAPPEPRHGARDLVEALRDRAAELLCACYLPRERFVAVGGIPVPADVVACTGAIEIAVHGWDVSAARGYDCPIPPALAERLLPLCPMLLADRKGLFADPVEVPPDASPSDRLVGYLGRDPVVTTK
jgi:uncharacterized protein (TIGR03086 family)